MADCLVAWLYDTPVAVLVRGPEFRIRLERRPEGIERWGVGSPALSVGLPIGAPAGPRDTRGLDFFENILPEGPALERMAALAGVRPVDTYGILAAFGRDCAGAIMVLPDGDRPGGNGGSGYSPMTPGDLQRVIGTLDVTPLAAAPERGFRPSLAGFQRKALLGRAGDGTWQLPSGDAPSTWILKPDGPHAIELSDSMGQPMRADTHLGQRVGGQADIRKVTAASLIDEAVSWGIRRRAASAVVTETLDQVLAAISATPGDARVLAVIREQAERISRAG